MDERQLTRVITEGLYVMENECEISIDQVEKLKNVFLTDDEGFVLKTGGERFIITIQKSIMEVKNGRMHSWLDAIFLPYL